MLFYIISFLKKGFQSSNTKRKPNMLFSNSFQIPFTNHGYSLEILEQDSTNPNSIQTESNLGLELICQLLTVISESIPNL